MSRFLYSTPPDRLVGVVGEGPGVLGCALRGIGVQYGRSGTYGFRGADSGAAASADATGSAGASVVSQLSDPLDEQHQWRVTNHTEQSVWGELNKVSGPSGRNTSSIGIALAPSASSGVGTLKVEYAYKDYTQGRLCFNKSWWDLGRAAYPFTKNWKEDVTTFELVQSGADGQQLAVNVEGQQFPLTPGGGTC